MADQDKVTLQLRPEVLDQVVKSVMQSVTANSAKRRRLNNHNGQPFKDATREGALLSEGLTDMLDAQRTSFTEGS